MQTRLLLQVPVCSAALSTSSGRNLMYLQAATSSAGTQACDGPQQYA